MEKSLSLFPERDYFAHSAARTERVAQFVEGTTEACSRLDGSKTMHRIVPLFDAPMILLQPIIEVFTRSMLDVVPHCLANGTWIGRMTIRRHLIRNRANHSNSLLEKSPGRLHIPFFAQQRIHQIAIMVNGSIQITPLPMHFEVGFIDIPGCSCLSSSFGS
jgi:hypothetical protein